MNNIINIVFIGFIVLLDVSTANNDEMKQALFKKCVEQEGATDADIQAMSRKELPVTRTGKCMNACIFENIGIIVDGKFVPAGGVELTRMASNNDPKLVGVAQAVTEECKTVANADRCELAHETATCTMEAASKRGIDPKLLF